MSQYLTEGLERARESLNEAAAMRDRYVIGSSVSRRVAAAAASAVSLSFSSVWFIFGSQIRLCPKIIIIWENYLYFKYLQAEAAASAGESSFRSFMIAVQRCASSVAILQQVICADNYF